MNLVLERFNPNLRDHDFGAQMFSAWSREGGMKPFTVDMMTEFPLGVVAFDKREFGLIPAGYAALTSYRNGHGIVGGHIVNPNLRGQGVGRAVLEGLFTEIALGENFQDIKSLMARANKNSRLLHEAAGGEFVGMRRPRAANGCNYTMDLMLALLRKRELAAAVGGIGTLNTAPSDTLKV